MLALLTSVLAAAAPPGTTVPPAAVPAQRSDSVLGSIARVFDTAFERLGENGYHTAVALILMTIAILIGINLRANRFVLIPVAIGSFWAGWLGWNTITAGNAQLFDSDIEATTLWDIALASERGFLLVVVVACVGALFLWRTSISLFSRIALLLFAILGTSFLYNLYEAIRFA